MFPINGVALTRPARSACFEERDFERSADLVEIAPGLFVVQSQDDSIELGEVLEREFVSVHDVAYEAVDDGVSGLGGDWGFG